MDAPSPVGGMSYFSVPLMPGAHRYGLKAKVHLSAGAGSPAYAGREIAISVINARPTRRVRLCLLILSVSFLPGYFAFFSSSLST